jgi:hypothetical protein
MGSMISIVYYSSSFDKNLSSRFSRLMTHIAEQLQKGYIESNW